QELKEFTLLWCFGCRDSIASRSPVLPSMEHPMTRNLIRSVASLFSILALVAAIGTASAQPASGPVTLFNNVRVFDGKNHSLSKPTNVLVRGNLIERISEAPIPTDRAATTTIIDGGGRTLMPGLIDNHWHAMLARVTP